MSVWKRLQRVGKKAAKFKYTASYQELTVECSKNYKPGKLIIVWTRRSRRYQTKPLEWQPSTQRNNVCNADLSVPENVDITTTLFRNSNPKDGGTMFEEKEWTFQIEDLGDKLSGGRRRILAHRSINIAEYASAIPSQNVLKINMKLSSSRKVTSAVLFLTLHCLFLKEGEATDEDMISIASLMSIGNANSSNSMSNISGIADLSELEEPNFPSSFHENLNELTAKLNTIEDDEDAQNARQTRTDSSLSLENSNDLFFIKEDSTPTFETPKNPSNPFETNITEKEKRISDSENHKSGDTSTMKEIQPSTAATPLQSSNCAKENSLHDNSANTRSESVSNTETLTSTQDLLSWCQQITKNYPGVEVTNFTTSFRNGLAFCAIIHYYCPQQIEFFRLNANDIKENNRLAFEAAARMGIPKVIEASDMVLFKIPDKLSVMTYLHQLRTHFTKKNLQLTHASLKTSESSYAVQDEELDDSNPFSSDIKKMEHVNNGSNPSQTTDNGNSLSRHDELKQKARKFLDESSSSRLNSNDPPTSNSGNPFEEFMKESPHNDSSISNKTRRISVKKRQPKLLKFNIDGSVKEDTTDVPSGKMKKLKISKLNFHDKPRTNNQTPDSSKDSPDKKNPFSRNTARSQSTRISNSRPGANEQRLNPFFNDIEDSPQNTPSIENRRHSEGNLDSLEYRYALSEKATDETLLDAGEYVANEMLALEREQKQIDDEAARLEKLLRQAMTMGGQNEDKLMQQWFMLVNKKNALIRRSMQLSMLVKEHDLEKRSQLLERELRQIITIEDWRKSEELKRREALLLKEFITIVNQRDEIVNELDAQEKAIEVDMEVERQTKIETTRKKQPARLSVKHSEKECVVQ